MAICLWDMYRVGLRGIGEGRCPFLVAMALKVFGFPLYGSCYLKVVKRGTVKILSQIDRGGLGPALL